jgi:hypothetical protein
MFLSYRLIVTSALCATLAACSGSFDDEFIQVDGTLKGIVCIDGIHATPGGGMANEIVERLFQYYGSEGNTAKVTSARGYGANCKDWQAKEPANLILTKEFYESTIVPETKY